MVKLIVTPAILVDQVGCTAWMDKAQSRANLVTYAKDLSLMEKSALNDYTQYEKRATNLVRFQT